MGRNVSVEEFINILAKMQHNVTSEQGKAVAEGCALIQKNAQEIMEHTTIDTSKTYYKHNKTIGHHPSAEGNPPAIDTGNLRRSITYNMISESEGEVGSLQATAPYGFFLEVGTSRMPRPRPWLKPATDMSKEKIKQIFTKLVDRGIKNV